MLRFTNSIFIARPRDEVFAFLSDFGNVPTWNYYVERVTNLTGGSPRLGTEFHQTRRVDWQVYRVTGFEPGVLVEVTTTEGSPAFRRALRMEDAPGGTLVNDEWDLDIGIASMAAALVRPRVRGAVMENLEKLKELLEQGRTKLQDGRVAATVR